MKVFISWSGERSRRVAEALRDWLPQVIQAVQPWVSAADVDKGARWAAQIAEQLAETKVGILCLAPDNLTAPWLIFEAGALSKTLENTYVCPYLLGVEVTAIQGPLAQFQATRATQEDTVRLVKTINGALGESALKEGQVNAAFAKWWPELEQRLAQATAVAAQGQAVAPARTDRNILEEVLALVRGLARDASDRERYESFAQAVSRKLGVFDTTTTMGLGALGLPPSPIQQAFFDVGQKAKLQAIMERLVQEGGGLLGSREPQPPKPPPEPPPEPPLKLTRKPKGK